MSQKYWDILLEVGVQSNKDDSIYTGLFNDITRRALQNVDDIKHPFEFSPTITNFNSTIISIKFNFKDPSKLTLSNQASLRINVKEPSLLRTKISMSPMTRKQIFKGEDNL